MNSFITTTTVMNTSANRKHCHASDKVIKLLALYLQQANSEQELYDNGTIVSLSTYHLEKLNEKLSDFELTQKREANQNKILKWIMDNIVNSYDTIQVTNNDLEIIMKKFQTIVSSVEIFYKKLRRFEHLTESEKISLDLSYFQYLKEIRITGKSTTCTFNLGSILNSNELKQITFYRNVIVDSFDKIVSSQTNRLIFIDCPQLISKMENDDCFGKSILEHTESLSIENCEITDINNSIFKENREWKNLKNFKLTKTNVDKILLPGLKVPNLTDLCLLHNSISNIKFSKNNSICTVNLTVLDLSFNLLENLDYFSVVKLPNLEIADVSNNYLENVVGLLQACDKEKLKQVYLHGNNILEWNQIYPLTYFDNLEALTLVENPLQKEEPDYLKIILNLFSNKTRPEFYFDGDIYYLDALPKYPFEIIDPKSILITLPPPPVENIPPPPGIPPPPMMGIPPPPGVPPPPGGMFKPKVKKEVSKTKNIHWKPIRNTKDKVKSVWVLEEEDDEEIDEEQKAIFEKLDNLFSAKKTSSPAKKVKNPKQAIDDELNTVIDSSLARNLEILVNGLFKYSELKVLLDAINTMNVENLTIDQIKGLSQFVPATEEIVKKKEIIEKYFDNLRPSLLWTWKLAEISILPTRLQLMQHMKTFDVTKITDTITSKLNTVDNLQNSKSFVKLLHMLLKVGNYMNRGKAQLEEAQGFHLNILPKLSDTKSSINPKTTLVHFLAETLKNEKSELFNFEIELESYGVCSPDIFNIKLDMIQQDLKEIQDVRELFQSKKSDIDMIKKKEKNHKIEANFSSFLSKCNESVSNVESLFEKLNNSYKMACDFFHFNPTEDDALSIPGDPLLVIVKDFINQFKKSKDDLDKEERKNQQALKRTLTLKRIQSESKISTSSPSSPMSPSSPLSSPLTPSTPTTPSTPPISTKSVDFLKKRQLPSRSKSYSDLDDENNISPLLKARSGLKKASGLRNVKVASDFATPEKNVASETVTPTAQESDDSKSNILETPTMISNLNEEKSDDGVEEKVTLVEDVNQLTFEQVEEAKPEPVVMPITPQQEIVQSDEISAETTSEKSQDAEITSENSQEKDAMESTLIHEVVMPITPQQEIVKSDEISAETTSEKSQDAEITIENSQEEKGSMESTLIHEAIITEATNDHEVISSPTEKIENLPENEISSKLEENTNSEQEENDQVNVEDIPLTIGEVEAAVYDEDQSVAQEQEPTPEDNASNISTQEFQTIEKIEENEFVTSDTN